MQAPIPQQESPYETARRAQNIAAVGVVVEVRHTHPARCRVQLGGNTTDWLPWFERRAAGQRGATWWPPEVGEQCLVISPGGDLLQGMVLLGIPSDANPPPSDEPDTAHTVWSPRDRQHWKGGNLAFEIENEILLKVGKASIQITDGAITLKSGEGGEIVITDKVYASPDAIAQGISLTEHKHTGVVTGPSTTGGPV